MLFGGSGNDTLDGGPGADTMIGGPGMDTADYSVSAAAVNVNLLTGLGSGGDAQGDILGGIENIIGSAQADTLTGDNGANTFVGGAGADTLNGGLGIDTADYSASAAAVNVNLVTGLGAGGDAQGDVLGGIENIIGSARADTLTGDNGANAFVGGAGADTFVFDLAALTPAQPGFAVVDRILDYNQGNSGTFNLAEGDTLDFSALLSAGSGQPVGNLVRRAGKSEWDGRNPANRPGRHCQWRTLDHHRAARRRSYGRWREGHFRCVPTCSDADRPRTGTDPQL